MCIRDSSSSPPLDSEDEETLSRLVDKFLHVFYTSISLGDKRFRPQKVSRVLRARNILLSVSELCGTLDGLMELVVSLGLAESAYAVSYTHLLQKVREYCDMLGREVTVLRLGTPIQGIAVDIDSDARLIIRTKSGENVHVVSGEVRIGVPGAGYCGE